MRKHGIKLFLFQDEFMVSGKARIMSFCEALDQAGLNTSGRLRPRQSNRRGNHALHGGLGLLRDPLRHRIRLQPGAQAHPQGIHRRAVEIVAKAVTIFDRTDCFYVWGFPFETMEDFYQSVFQMVSFRAMGARILPSMLCLLPQTEIYRNLPDPAKLEFCTGLFRIHAHGPRALAGGTLRLKPAEHARIFEFVRHKPDIFGLFHYDLNDNILPKLRVLQEFGFYGGPRRSGGHGFLWRAFAQSENGAPGHGLVRRPGHQRRTAQPGRVEPAKRPRSVSRDTGSTRAAIHAHPVAHIGARAARGAVIATVTAVAVIATVVVVIVGERVAEKAGRSDTHDRQARIHGLHRPPIVIIGGGAGFTPPRPSNKATSG